jgi:glycosyltransferase involved in cell wall biosynthesis
MTSRTTVHVCLEERFVRTPDGSVWTTNSFGNDFWARYREVFDEVAIIARVGERHHPSPRAEVVDLEGVRFVEVPYYQGPREFARVAIPAWQTIRKAAGEPGAFILRLPGLIGTIAGNRLMATGKAFGVELVGDIEAVLDSGVGGALAPAFKRYLGPATKRICANATAVSYMTARYLQEKYPPADASRAVQCPSVDLTKFSLGRPPRTPSNHQPIRILTAGSLEQRYKGVDVLLRALAQLRDQGFAIEARVAGDGIFRAELEALRDALGLTQTVTFLGWVAVDRLISELDAADIFVLASRTEGLPRAIIEAMTLGLPVVGTRVGGIPELLSEDCLVPSEDVAALARTIGRLAGDPAERAALSRRNIEAAKDYGDDKSGGVRRAFYTLLKDKSSMPD